MECFDLGLDVNWNAITGIGTLLLAVGTFASIIYNHISIKKSQKMWEEDNRPVIIFTIVISSRLYFLKVENIGRKVAYNIKFKVNAEFLSKIPESAFKEKFIELCNKKINLAPNRAQYYAIIPIQGYTITNSAISVDEMKKHIINIVNEPIAITGSYNDRYKIKESFSMDEYTGSYVIPDPINEINESLKVISEVNKRVPKKRIRPFI